MPGAVYGPLVERLEYATYLAGHNDPIAILLALAGIQERWTVALLSLAVATASKVWLVVVFPIFMGLPQLRSLRKWGARLIAIPVLGTAVSDADGIGELPRVVPHLVPATAGEFIPRHRCCYG